MSYDLTRLCLKGLITRLPRTNTYVLATRKGTPSKSRGLQTDVIGEAPTCGDVPCVEVAFLPGHRLIRDSKLGDASPVLAVSPAEWSAFTAVVKAGRLDG